MPDLMLTHHTGPIANAPTEPAARPTHFVEICTATHEDGHRASFCVRADKKQVRWGAWVGGLWHYKTMDIEDVMLRHIEYILEQMGTSATVVTPDPSSDGS